jgi:hypothetical protein
MIFYDLDVSKKVVKEYIWLGPSGGSWCSSEWCFPCCAMFFDSC